ncbi:MAG TPA: CPBP family intramembrane glutamic endopeptidase [Chloroflexia bacterium]|nr:CPBP family intramembrane glutamic endopeptidase [Chloroflexia bacterium]
MAKVPRQIAAFLGSDDPAVMKTWLSLSVAGGLSAVAVLPYSLEMSNITLEELNKQLAAQGKKPASMKTIVGGALVQGPAMFALVSGLGLRAARPMGMGAPHLERVMRGKSAGISGQDAAKWAARGLAAGLVIAGLDRTVFAGVAEKLKQSGIKQPPAWKGLLATLYGGIGEELLLRLGMLSFLAAGLRKLTGDRSKPPSAGVMLPATVLAALLFGAGHLPAVARLAKIDGPLVVRTLALNGIAGVQFGLLYWKNGLEAAMISHGAADIVLHVLGPLVEGTGKKQNEEGQAAPQQEAAYLSLSE